MQEVDKAFRIKKSDENKNYEVFCRQVARKFKISDDVEIDGEAEFLTRIYVGENDTIRLWNVDADTGYWIQVNATYYKEGAVDV